MTERAFDAERLAAMLDGRLDAAQREELLKELDESPELLELLADAAAVMGEMEAEATVAAASTDDDGHVLAARLSREVVSEPAAAVDAAGTADDDRSGPTGTASIDTASAAGGRTDAPPPNARVDDLSAARARKGIPRRAVWILAAAVVAGIVVAPVFRKATRGGDGDPAAYASLGTFAAAGAPAEWDRTPWSGSDARGIDDGLPAPARAVRLGAFITDAQVAARTGDPRLAAVAGDVQRLLAPIVGAGAVSSYYDDIVAGRVSGPAAEPALRDGARAIAQLPDAEGVRDGAWLEAARMAAARHDAAFFADGDSRDRARRLASAGSVSESSRAALAQVASGDPPGDWSSLETSLTAALAALAVG